MADKKIDVIKIHCESTDLKVCKECPRELCISVSSIKLIIKNGGGNATFDTGEHYVHHYLCGPRLRTVKTKIPYEKLLKDLGLNIYNIGNTEMVYFKDTCGDE